MSNESAYQQVKRYITKDWETRKRLLPLAQQTAAKEERDRALAFLAQLAPVADTTPQPSLFAPTPHPIIELDPHLAARIDKLNEGIRTAGNTGKFADAAKLASEKGKLLRSQGL